MDTSKILICFLYVSFFFNMKCVRYIPIWIWFFIYR